MRAIFCSMLVIMSIMITGCGNPYAPYAPYTPPKPSYTVEDSSASSYSDKHIAVSITPGQDYHGAFTHFVLKIQNKNSNAMKLSWNNSYYLENENSANGGFYFEGCVYSRRTDPKQDMLILPGATTTIEIFPNVLTWYKSGRYDYGWRESPMVGNVGAYLAINGKNYEKNIKLMVKIAEVYQ